LNITIKFQVPLEKLNEFLDANFTDEFLAKLKSPNKPQETNQKPADGFLIAHFKR